MRKLQDRQELDQLIEAGSFGHFPLFYQSWIRESFSDSNELKKITFSRAAETVHKIFDKIERHRGIEKKKVAIQALTDVERNQFIVSFIKMVEYRTLDKLKDLH
jgi:hypothetical protein